MNNSSCRSGWSTVHQYFMRSSIFRNMLNQSVIVYIDDILVYSDTLKDHLQQVRTVLKCLIHHQLYVKLEKCDFYQTTTAFLGCIISPNGIAMNWKKVTAVLNWPQPSTLKELQWFLGFANFYRWFIRNFSTVTSPLMSMVIKGNHHLIWSPTALQSFQQLKEHFVTAPILHHPNPDLPFLVEVDASSSGLRAILS